MNYSKPITRVYDGKNVDFYIDGCCWVWLKLNQIQDITGREYPLDTVSTIYKVTSLINDESYIMVCIEAINRFETMSGTLPFFAWVKEQHRQIFNLINWLQVMADQYSETRYLRITKENMQIIADFIGLDVEDIWG